MNYYSFHIGDYAAHTRRLSLLEDLAYRRLLDEYYLQEEPLTGEADLIARQIGMADYVDEVDYVLTCFFESTPHGYINKRCDEEIEKYHAKHEQAIKAGRASAEKRLNKRSTSVQLTNNQEPITNNHIKEKSATKVACPSDVNEEIWNDWVLLRKTKKASVTNTVINSARKEAEKANITLEKFLEIWCLRGSQGLEASWLKQDEIKTKELPLGTEQQIEYAFKTECGGDPTKARFNSYYDMKKYILDQRDKRKAMQ